MPTAPPGRRRPEEPPQDTVPDPTQFENFREAFCAVYRCNPEDYGRQVFFRSMAPWRRPIARLILLTSPDVFAADFGLIDSLGDARTPSMCSSVLDELGSINMIERGFRRGLMGFRVSGGRLSDLYDSVQNHIREPEAQPTYTPKADDPAVARREERAAGRETLTSAAVMLRKLRQAHGELIRGIPPDEAARSTGFPSGAELLRHLAQHGGDHPEFKWISETIGRLGAVGQLEDENRRLKSMVADQGLEIARLKGGGGR